MGGSVDQGTGAAYHQTAETQITLEPLRKTLQAPGSALHYWQAEEADSGRKPHLRAGGIQSFGFSYELSMRLLRRMLRRLLRRMLMERAAAPPQVADLSFNDLLRLGADADLLPDAQGLRRWRELRNRTSHAYYEKQAQIIADAATPFLGEAQALLQRPTEAAGEGP